MNSSTTRFYGLTILASSALILSVAYAQTRSKTNTEQALRQRCIELQQHIQLDSFFTRIDKSHDARKLPIEGVAVVETSSAVISLRVSGLADRPRRQIRAGDTFQIFDRHYSVKYKILRVNREGVLFSFDATMPPTGNNRRFSPEFGSGKGQVLLSYKIPYLDARPWLRTKAH